MKKPFGAKKMRKMNVWNVPVRGTATVTGRIPPTDSDPDR